MASDLTLQKVKRRPLSTLTAKGQRSSALIGPSLPQKLGKDISFYQYNARAISESAVKSESWRNSAP